MPGVAAARDPRAHALLRRRSDHEPAARLPRRGAQAPRWTSRRHNRLPDGARVRRQVRRIPVYPAAAGYALDGPVALLASNESPVPADPRGRRGGREGARRAQPLPGPDERARCAQARRPLRRAAPSGSRSATAPATSCSPPARRCSSRAPSSSTRGRRSRSTRTSRRRPARARSRSPLDAEHRHDLDAMRARDHGRDAAGDRLQPEQPDLDRAAARGDRGVRRRASRATSA